jgi:NitT/TauT family transport system ATP-binding protein
VLRLTAVCKKFPGGTLALDDITLRINDEDFLVLLGPSGCGKSTLLRLIAGLEPPSAGSIDWTGRPPAPGEIGYVFQDATLMPWATALQNVALPLRLRAAPDAEALARAALAQVGLAEFAHARPKTLSGGMRMRVSIARALVSRPRLLLMDEPFAALDEFTRHRLQDECLSLAASLGCTTIFVTHSLYEAAYLASRVVLMSPRPGRIARELAGAAPTDRTRTGAEFNARVQVLSDAVQALHLPSDVTE